MPKAEAQRKANDDLLVMTHDCDLYIAPNVRQIMGPLISDRNHWALPTIASSPLNEFRRPDQPPVKDRAMFVYRNDPPPQGSTMVMNRILPAVESIATRRQWRPFKPIREQAGQIKVICALLSFVALMFFAWQATTTGSCGRWRDGRAPPPPRHRRSPPAPARPRAGGRRRSASRHAHARTRSRAGAVP